MSWQRIQGHDALVRSFQRVLQNDRLAHAYLFTGPPGIGKKLFAVELAKTLLCEGQESAIEPCDQCRSCRQIDADSHPDFFLERRPPEAHELPIDLMRDLCRRFSLTSARGRGKVAIVDDAEEMNAESANCFLKTLEEPPPRSVIILISTSPERQLSTIVSRCQVVRFAPLSRELVIEVLKRDNGADANLLEAVAQASEGSPGRARELSDPQLWAFRREWFRSFTSERAPSVELARQWMQFVEQAGSESAAQRRRAAQCVGLLIAFFRDALKLSLGASSNGNDPAEQQALRSLAHRFDAEQIMHLIERCTLSAHQLDRRAQLGLIVDALMDALGQQMHVGVAP